VQAQRRPLLYRRRQANFFRWIFDAFDGKHDSQATSFFSSHPQRKLRRRLILETGPAPAKQPWPRRSQD
jgi:hypothetical protein